MPVSTGSCHTLRKAISYQLYDGWAMIQEQSTTETNSYVYGLDLSGSMQGAGTIGGILWESLNGVVAFISFDGNGNLTDLTGVSGTSVAHYEYDPYGNTIVKTGSLADANPFRFSTKYYDNETGLIYYGLRFYSANLARWINRDPIGEEGGLLLYSFCCNASISAFDQLGLSEGDPVRFFYTSQKTGKDEEIEVPGAGTFNISDIKIETVTTVADNKEDGHTWVAYDYDIFGAKKKGNVVCRHINVWIKIEIIDKLNSWADFPLKTKFGYWSHEGSGYQSDKPDDAVPVVTSSLPGPKEAIIAHERGHAGAYVGKQFPTTKQVLGQFITDSIATGGFPNEAAFKAALDAKTHAIENAFVKPINSDADAAYVKWFNSHATVIYAAPKPQDAASFGWLGGTKVKYIWQK